LLSDLTRRQTMADRMAPIMFGLSLIFLALLASLIVIWVDMPRVAELAALSALEVEEFGPGADANLAEDLAIEALEKATTPYEFTGRVVLGLLIFVWLLFPLEFLLRYLQEQKSHTDLPMKWTSVALFCLAPPLRMSAPSAAWDNQIWLPRLNWQYPGRALSRHLTRLFSTPMLIIALLILPVLVIEYGLSAWVDRHAWLRMLLHISTGFIWFAFTVEFIVLIGAADKKLAYVRKNWIDLAIILLPLLSFLRSIRVLRLARLARVQKLAKVGRVYRMRGLLMKAVRALMLLEVVNRLLRITPEKKLARMQEHYNEMALELAELEQDIAEQRLKLSGSHPSVSVDQPEPQDNPVEPTSKRQRSN